MTGATRCDGGTGGVAMTVASRSPVVVDRHAQARLRAFQRQPLVYSVMSLYTIASIALMATHSVGLTSEHVILIGVLAFALVGRARPFVWDWLPFLFVAVMFEDLTSVSGAFERAPHATGPIALERTLLGGPVATGWLQAHLSSGELVSVLNGLLTSEYLVHFAAPLAMGLWLWARRREDFSRFVSAYMVLMATGFVVYLLFPEMPPWLAARNGLLPPVQRIVVDTLQHLGGFGRVYAGADPEPNAAMPALHVAVPMLIACAMIGGVRVHRRAVWLWLVYPLTVAFGVVYMGEHYVVDTWVGIAFGAGAFWVVKAAERVSLRRTFVNARHVVTAPRGTLVPLATRGHLARRTKGVSRPQLAPLHPRIDLHGPAGQLRGREDHR